MRCRVAFLAGVAALCALAQVGAPAHAAEGLALTISMDGTGTGAVECEVGEGPAEACDASYPEGTELALVPSPGPGSEFVEFFGDCGPAECELTMNEAKSVTATFDLIQVAEFPLTLKFKGTGSGTVECQADSGPYEACKAAYPEGTELTLTPMPDEDSEFLHFSGDCEDEACDLTMDGAHTVNVFFTLIPVTPEYAFTLKIKGAGSGSVLCEAQEGPEECQPKYPAETELALLQKAAPGSEFAGWSGSFCSGTGACEVTMEGARSVTATFSLPPPPPLDYVLSVERLGSGSGTVTSDPAGIDCGSDCSESFFEGTKVTLTAAPAPGSVFDHWTGGGCSGSGACKVTMEGARSVTATFSPPPPPLDYVLSVERLGSGSGTVTSDPAGIDCGSDCSEAFLEGTKVTLTATAAPGSSFDHWTGGSCSGSGACKVTMSTVRTVKAVFVATDGGTVKSPKAGAGSGSAKGSLALATALAKVRAGKALLRIVCAGEGACRGKLKLLARLAAPGSRVTIGTTSFSLPAGASRTLRVGLSRRAREMLSRSARGLRASVTGTGVEGRQVRLKRG